jgi:hypothetical protein
LIKTAFFIIKATKMTAILNTPPEPPFSNLQIELLKLFTRELSEADLLEIKLLLARHFLEKSMNAADKVWTNSKWTATSAVQFSHDHHRTPYKAKN